MAKPATDLSLDSAALLAAEEHAVSIVGRSPWYLAWRRLRRNYIALGFLVLFFVIVIACALAPVYAHHVAHTGPTQVVQSVEKDGKRVDVVTATETTFDPTTGELRESGSAAILGP